MYQFPEAAEVSGGVFTSYLLLASIQTKNLRNIGRLRNGFFRID